MAHNTNQTSSLPADLVERHQKGWNAFTSATKVTCISVATLLLLMLIFLRLL